MAKQIYLYYGEEDYLIDERIAELQKGLGGTALNVERLDGDEPDQEQIMTALQSQSLLGGDKLVIIENVDLSSEIWAGLTEAFKHLDAGTRVVFRAVKVDRRLKFFKFIESIGEVQEYKTFAAWEQSEVVAWINRRVRASGYEIETPAAVRLLEICGSGLRKLASEINKLITYVGARHTIKEADVFALASPGETNVFALSEAVADKDLSKALSTLRLLAKNRADFFQLLSLLTTQFRLMLQIKKLSSSQRSPQQLAQTLGANPFFVKKCQAKAGKFSETELIINLELILETDLKLKTGESNLANLELLLVSFCQPAAAGQLSGASDHG